jgi:hypothetical protein
MKQKLSEAFALPLITVIEVSVAQPSRLLPILDRRTEGCCSNCSQPASQPSPAEADQIDLDSTADS